MLLWNNNHYVESNINIFITNSVTTVVSLIMNLSGVMYNFYNDNMS